jgi:hypothetical protein
MHENYTVRPAENKNSTVNYSVLTLRRIPYEETAGPACDSFYLRPVLLLIA